VRADVLVDWWEAGPVVIETKTYDPRCASWRNKTPAEAELELGKRGASQYAPGTMVRVLVLGADGTVGFRARALLMELIAMREDRGALLTPPRPRRSRAERTPPPRAARAPRCAPRRAACAARLTTLA